MSYPSSIHPAACQQFLPAGGTATPEIDWPQGRREYGDPLSDVNGLFLNYAIMTATYHNGIIIPNFAETSETHAQAGVRGLSLAGGLQKAAS